MHIAVSEVSSLQLSLMFLVGHTVIGEKALH